jgi:PAS domain S-box-containing protein
VIAQTMRDDATRRANLAGGTTTGMAWAEHLPDSAFKALIAAAPDGVIVADRQGTILLANPEVGRLTGWQPEELIGQKIEVLVPVAARGSHVGHRDGYAARPHARPMGANLQLWAQRKDGSQLAVEIMLSPVTLDGGPATIAFLRDATERRRRQQELEDANAATTSANRELEAFSYSVAHDLRAPLRSIDGFAQALLEDNAPQLDDVGKNYLDRIRVNAQRMGRLIDDLLALARLSRAELKREPVDLGRLARDAARALAQAEPDRDVVVTIAEDLRARGDARMLGIAITNLISNAWKFTRTRSRAHLEVGRRDDAYFVRDDGVGFDMAHATHLFAPFKRLHAAREFEGTGVGLATVARVIQRHGGRIWAEATPDAGATFWFTLGTEESR